LDADFALVVSGVQEKLPALAIILPDGVPELVPPGVPVEITVRILEGAEAIVPGSELMYYRLSPDDDFAAVALELVSGSDYLATLPKLKCDDVPQFYFSVEGDGGTVVTSPPTAPDGFYSFDIGEIYSFVLFEERFEEGLPPGWETSGLWHVTTECVVEPVCDGLRWAYYGLDSSCDYETGDAHFGSLASPPIDLPPLPPGGDIIMEYCSTLETEEASSYDLTEVYVNGSLIESVPDSSEWQVREVSLNAFGGETVTIEWRFDTVDSVYNDYHGWQVDAIRIIASEQDCIDPCPADVTGDGVVDVLDLIAVLAAWGQSDVPEDINGDGIVDVLDLLEVLTAWGPCA